MTENQRQVSVSRVIAAPPDRIFEVLADPAQHPEIDGSGTVKKAKGDVPARLGLGSTFGMDMRIGLPYPVKNTVVEFEPDRLIAWRHFAHHVWRYELESTDGGTQVTETFDWSGARSPKFVELMGYPRKHPAAMQRTLERLDQVVSADRAGGDPEAGDAGA